MGLAKHDGRFEPAGETMLNTRELLAALRQPVLANPGSRSRAVANCLSGQDGWRDAATELGGAFAAPGDATRLMKDKE